MKQKCLLWILFATLMLLVGACDDGQYSVHMGATNFVQSSITIKKGGSITLIDDVATTHIIENGMWDPETGTERPKIEPNAPTVDAQIGGSGNQRTIGPFNTAGTFHLYCTVHPGMNLTVVVQ